MSESTLNPVPPVSGYRQLSQAEVDLMNEGKALFSAVGHYLDKLHGLSMPPIGEDYPNRPAPDGRCIAIARTEAQTAAMWAMRAITKPSGFA